MDTCPHKVMFGQTSAKNGWKFQTLQGFVIHVNDHVPLTNHQFIRYHSLTLSGELILFCVTCHMVLV